MKVSLILDFDREISVLHPAGIMTVRCTAEIWREYDRLFMRDFEADEDLRPMERELAETRLLSHAYDYLFAEIANYNSDEMARHRYGI